MEAQPPLLSCAVQPPLSSGLWPDCTLSTFSPPRWLFGVSHNNPSLAGQEIASDLHPDHEQEEVGGWRLTVVSSLQRIRLRNHSRVFSQLCYKWASRWGTELKIPGSQPVTHHARPASKASHRSGQVSLAEGQPDTEWAGV